MKKINEPPFIITSVHNAIPTCRVLEIHTDLYIISTLNGYKIVGSIEPDYNGKALVRIKQIIKDRVDGNWTIYKVVGECGELYGFRTDASVIKLFDVELEWIGDIHEPINLTPYLHLDNTTQINLSAGAHIHISLKDNQSIHPVHLDQATNGTRVTVVIEGIGTITHHEHPDVIYNWKTITISPVETPFTILEFYKSNYKWYCTSK